jgi:hypothetical protein
LYYLRAVAEGIGDSTNLFVSAEVSMVGGGTAVMSVIIILFFVEKKVKKEKKGDRKD